MRAWGVAWPASPPVGRAGGGARGAVGRGRSIGLAIPMLSVVIPIGIKRVSRLAVSRDNVRASPGRFGGALRAGRLSFRNRKRRIFSDNSASGRKRKSDRRTAAAIGLQIPFLTAAADCFA